MPNKISEQPFLKTRVFSSQNALQCPYQKILGRRIIRTQDFSMTLLSYFFLISPHLRNSTKSLGLQPILKTRFLAHKTPYNVPIKKYSAAGLYALKILV